MLSLKQALTEAGIEIYGETDTELRIAERHRYHLMDSGVIARPEGSSIVVTFALRAQRSDFARVDASAIYEKLRAAHGEDIEARGYRDEGENVVEVVNPVDSTKILDTWYEVSFSKSLPDHASAVEEIRWALTVEKYIHPS